MSIVNCQLSIVKWGDYLELTDISYIRNLLSGCGFSFSKALGQNFIINPSVCPKMAEAAGCGENICALEIGPGIGVLTKELASRCNYVVAVEIDQRLKPILNETLKEYDNIEIIYGDVMELDLAAIIKEKFAGRDVIVCANLPYYITSPVIMRLLEERLPIRSLTVMVQLEAAKRLCALSGERDCGAVTAAVRYYSSPKLLFKVSRGSFMPPPNVDSAVIKLDIYDKSPYMVEDEKLFFRIIRGSFSQRRKQLVNPLSASLNIEKSVIAHCLTECGISANARPEQLKLEDFVALYRQIKNII